MGAFWSKKDNQFEKVLEKLDQNISYIEQRQITATTNRKKLIAYLIYLSVFSELVFVSWFYFHKKPTALVDQIIDAYPLALPPVLGYIFSWLITFLYTTRIRSDEKKLLKLRADLKHKLDERKQATGYDTTQQLLSKYEKVAKQEAPTSPRGNKKGQQAHPQQQSPAQQQQGQGGQIRQRNPAQPTNPSQPLTTPPPARPPVAGQPTPTLAPNLPNRPPMPTGPVSKSWMDKLVDYVVGGEPQHSYALICSSCKAHNGLVPQAEMKGIEFRCRFCNHFNQSVDSAASASSSSTPSSQMSPVPPPPPPPTTTPGATTDKKGRDWID